MRDYKGMKRQRGRNRGGGGQNQGGGKPGQNANRAFDSNGPDNIKVRGHAQHVYEKYNQLARDASSAGDRVLAENHLQHAEHYFRTLRVLQPNRPVTEIVGRDTFVNGFDLDFEDEALESAMAEADASAGAPATGAPVSEGEGSAEPRADRFDRQGGERQERQGEGQRQDRQGGERQDRQGEGQRREFRDRSDRNGGDRPRFDRQPRWEDRPQGGDRQGEGRPAGEFRQDGRGEPRQGSDRGDRPRYERQRWEDRGERSAEAADTAGMVAPESAAPPPSTFEPQPYEASAREPREAGPVLRSEDGGVSEAPAFLSGGAPPASDDGEPRRPRARRPRRRAEGDAAPTEGSGSDEG